MINGRRLVRLVGIAVGLFGGFLGLLIVASMMIPTTPPAAAPHELSPLAAGLTLAIKGDWQPLGWDISAYVADNGHNHVVVVPVFVIPKPEAKEVALRVLDRYLEVLPPKSWVHVQVVTAGGQELARATDYAR